MVKYSGKLDAEQLQSENRILEQALGMHDEQKRALARLAAPLKRENRILLRLLSETRDILRVCANNYERCVEQIDANNAKQDELYATILSLQAIGSGDSPASASQPGTSLTNVACTLDSIQRAIDVSQRLYHMDEDRNRTESIPPGKLSTDSLPSKGESSSELSTALPIRTTHSTTQSHSPDAVVDSSDTNNAERILSLSNWRYNSSTPVNISSLSHQQSHKQKLEKSTATTPAVLARHKTSTIASIHSPVSPYEPPTRPLPPVPSPPDVRSHKSQSKNSASVHKPQPSLPCVKRTRQREARHEIPAQWDLSRPSAFLTAAQATLMIVKGNEVADSAAILREEIRPPEIASQSHGEQPSTYESLKTSNPDPNAEHFQELEEGEIIASNANEFPSDMNLVHSASCGITATVNE